MNLEQRIGGNANFKSERKIGKSIFCEPMLIILLKSF